MPKVSVEDAQNYTQSDFFSLKDDGDYKEVRLMYDNLEDIPAYIGHQVVFKFKGKDYKKFVSCLRNDIHEPESNCPFCQGIYDEDSKTFINKIPAKPRLYLQLYNEKSNKVQVWDKPYKFYNDLRNLIKRQLKGKLVSNIVEIVRNGEKGDPQTQYVARVVDSDSLQLKDLPSELQVEGKFIYVKTAEEMLEYFDVGYFKAEDEDKEDEKPARRSTTARRSTSASSRPATPPAEEPAARHRSTETQKVEKPVVEDELDVEPDDETEVF